MAETENARFQNLIDGLSSSRRDEKLLSINALGILKIPEHADLLVDLLASPDEEVLAQVIKALGKIGNPRSVKHIIEFVVEDHGILSKIAYQVLKDFYLASALDVVIKAASPDQPVEIRRKLIQLLGAYEDLRVASLMNEILGQTQDTHLLTEAIHYFIRFPSAERHTSLRMLSNNSQWEVSLAANLALSRLKDEGATSQIRRLLKSPNSEVRLAIVEGLNCFPLIEDRLIYKKLFEDQKTEVRSLAVKGLEMFGSDERITILKDWLTREKDPSIRKQLLKRATKEASPLLFDIFFKVFVDAPSDELKEIVVKGISKMGEKIVDRIIIDFDKMALVIKEQMVIVLGNIGAEKSFNTIKECLKGKDRWLKINAIEAIAKIKAPELIQELLDLLEEKNIDIWVRATLVSALGRIGNMEHAQLLAKQLKHEDARVRANAIEALSALNWEGLIEACHELMKDRNDRVRVNAAIALANCKDKTVFDELEKMSKDKSKWVRSSAVFAIGKIGAKEVTPILLNMLKDKEDIVYKNTVEALGNSGDLRALTPLLNESKAKRLPEKFFEKILSDFSKNIRD